MRTVADRIRHMVSFEIIGLIIVTPLGAWAFSMPLHDIGVVSLAAAIVAGFWNYLYNFCFDHLMVRFAGGTEKSLALRIVHAVFFELGLLILLVPFIAWYLGVSFIHALVMDIGFASFYMIYAFVFNLAYDRIFPLPEWAEAGSEVG